MSNLPFMTFVIKPGVDPMWESIFVIFPEVDRMVEELIILPNGETDYEINIYFKDDNTIPYSIHDLDEESDLREVIEEIVLDGIHMSTVENS